jgi:hypothetical protein
MGHGRQQTRALAQPPGRILKADFDALKERESTA